ncbi:MAG: helix-turn-helix transcriptional regulator [Actinomycetes bacterium]|jgi:DNA-binding CsgD family transcriptional regulator|nr:LuxR family transcriptional regulator [Acidimicrobiia bacterium]
MATAVEVGRRRRDLLRRIAKAPDTDGVFREAARSLRRLVDFDAIALVGTDPTSGLPTCPIQTEGVEGMTAALCSDHWEREFVVTADVARFRDLYRAENPAASLRASVDDPSQSPRFAAFLRRLDFYDELRVVCRANDVPWALITMWRRQGEFSERDVDLMASLSAPVAEQVRARAMVARANEKAAAPDSPGVVVQGPDGKVQAITQQARELIEAVDDPDDGERGDSDLPFWLVALGHEVRSRARLGGAAERVRVRARDGSWLMCHASVLFGPDGRPTQTVIVIERARPGEVVPIAVEAYDLTERERQIAALIGRGLDTGAIADRLYLSTHTVRDHVKALLAKVGVSSRAELVAALFAEVSDYI